MINEIKVPQKYENAYFRLIEQVPVPFRYDLSVQQMILETLKSKGEEFVSDQIQSTVEAYNQKNG
jgi:hypothetical protein